MKAWDKAREAYEMAAKCAQRQDSPWHAAKHLEKAAEAAKETSDWTLVVEYYKNASLAYREAGRAQSAADALSKGARLIEDKDPEVGSSTRLLLDLQRWTTVALSGIAGSMSTCCTGGELFSFTCPGVSFWHI